MSLLVLLLVAVIWGTAFVAQAVGMDHLGPFSFNAIRYFIGSVSLIPVIAVVRKIQNRKGEGPATEEEKKNRLIFTVKGGLFCGIVLCVASLLQQFGIIYTSVGKAGFITALYIIIVPFFSVIIGKKIKLKAWLAAIIAIIGFYFMCVDGVDAINIGDILVLSGAFVWAVHILLIDHFAPKAEVVLMSAVQFFVSGVLCGILAAIFETVSLQAIKDCLIPLLYAGVLSCGIAYTLQIAGQKRVEPTLACLVLSLESVFSAIAGWIVLGQRMAGIEIVGCLLAFAGVIVAQLPAGKMKKGDA